MKKIVVFLMAVVFLNFVSAIYPESCLNGSEPSPVSTHTLCANLPEPPDVDCDSRCAFLGENYYSDILQPHYCVNYLDWGCCCVKPLPYKIYLAVSPFQKKFNNLLDYEYYTRFPQVFTQTKNVDGTESGLKKSVDVSTVYDDYFLQLEFQKSLLDRKNINVSDPRMEFYIKMQLEVRSGLDTDSLTAARNYKFYKEDSIREFLGCEEIEDNFVMCRYVIQGWEGLFERGTEIRFNVSEIAGEKVDLISNSFIVAQSQIMLIPSLLEKNIQKFKPAALNQIDYINSWSEINDLDETGEIKPETAIKYIFLNPLPEKYVKDIHSKISNNRNLLENANPELYYKTMSLEYHLYVLRVYNYMRKNGLDWHPLKKDAPVFFNENSLLKMITLGPYTVFQMELQTIFFVPRSSITPYVSPQAYISMNVDTREWLESLGEQEGVLIAKYRTIPETLSDDLLLHEYGHWYGYCDIYHPGTYYAQNNRFPGGGCINKFSTEREFIVFGETPRDVEDYYEGNHYKDFDTAIPFNESFNFVSIYGEILSPAPVSGKNRIPDKPNTNVCPIRSFEYGNC